MGSVVQVVPPQRFLELARLDDAGDDDVVAGVVFQILVVQHHALVSEGRESRDAGRSVFFAGQGRRRDQ